MTKRRKILRTKKNVLLQCQSIHVRLHWRQLPEHLETILIRVMIIAQCEDQTDMIEIAAMTADLSATETIAVHTTIETEEEEMIVAHTIIEEIVGVEMIVAIMIIEIEEVEMIAAPMIIEIDEAEMIVDLTIIGTEEDTIIDLIVAIEIAKVDLILPTTNKTEDLIEHLTM